MNMSKETLRTWIHIKKPFSFWNRLKVLFGMRVTIYGKLEKNFRTDDILKKYPCGWRVEP